MRKLLLFVALIAIIVSCGKNGSIDTTKITIPFDLDKKMSFNFPKSVPVGLVSLPNIPSSINLDSVLKANGTSLDQLQSLKTKSIVLSLTNPPSGVTLHFLKSIQFYISATGQTEQSMAYKVPVPDSVGTTMNLDIPDLNLIPYMKQSSFNLRVSFEQRDTLKQQVNLQTDMTLHFTAYLIK